MIIAIYFYYIILTTSFEPAGIVFGAISASNSKYSISSQMVQVIEPWPNGGYSSLRRVGRGENKRDDKPTLMNIHAELASAPSKSVQLH